VGEPYVESFNGRVRDELLNLEEFTSLTVAQVVVEAWRIEYNTTGPTPPSAASPPPSTRPRGPAPTNPSSHSDWTTYWGPIKVNGAERPFPARPQALFLACVSTDTWSLTG
jgi:hypothetical protein